MNILLLAPHPFYQNRGTPIAVRLLLEALVERGHQVDVLAYGEGEEVEMAGVRLLRVPRLPGVKNIPPGPSWKKLPTDAVMTVQALKLARSGRYRLIHAVEEAAFMARAIGLLTGLPYVYDMDSSLAEQVCERFPALGRGLPVFRGLEAWAIRGSRGVVAVCADLEEIARGCGQAEGVCRLEDISLLDVGWAAGGGQAETLAMGRPRLMYVGNLEPYQGAPLMLEAFALAREQAPGAQLVIIGGAPGHIAQLQARAEELGCGDDVHLLGPRPLEMLGGFLSQADILVSPRTQGRNTPMKIYSYLDSGKPIIATDIVSHTQVLDQSTALLTPPQPQAMAEAMARLLNDPALGQRLAANAKDLAQREFCLAAYRRKLGDFYARLERELGS